MERQINLDTMKKKFFTLDTENPPKNTAKNKIIKIYDQFIKFIYFKSSSYFIVFWLSL